MTGCGHGGWCRSNVHSARLPAPQRYPHTDEWDGSTLAGSPVNATVSTLDLTPSEACARVGRACSPPTPTRPRGTISGKPVVHPQHNSRTSINHTAEARASGTAAHHMTQHDDVGMDCRYTNSQHGCAGPSLTGVVGDLHPAADRHGGGRGCGWMRTRALYIYWAHSSGRPVTNIINQQRFYQHQHELDQA